MSRVLVKLSVAPIIIVFLFLAAISLNTDHMEERGHTDALANLATYESNECNGKWVYYSLTRGTVMVVCGLHTNQEPKQCLFIPFRVTENNGETILGEDEAYNCTAYVDACYKGNKFAGGEEGYQPWLKVPLDKRSAIKDAFGGF